MNKIIIATGNSHKTEEFKKIFSGSLIIEDLKTLNFKEEIIENGLTFIDNALIKCRTVYEKYKLPVLADDSGLSVNALNGQPGVLSARYGGENLNDRDRYELLLTNMKDMKDRSASFICALVLYLSPNRIYIVQEECSGIIADVPSGAGGFGYDPVFFLPQFGKTMAELSSSEKNSISHRGRASEAMKNIIKKEL